MMHLRGHAPNYDTDNGSTDSAPRTRFVESAKSELKQLEDQLTDIREQMETLQTERKRVASLAHSLRSYLRTQTGDAAYAESSPTADGPASDEHASLDATARASGPRSRVADVAYDVLAELGGKDMHYHELTDRVISRIGEFARTVSGCRVQLNTALNDDDRFLRPYRRGHYALRKDHPKAPNVGSRRGRRR